MKWIKFILKTKKGNIINVTPRWNKIGLKSGIVKFTIIFNKKVITKELIKTNVKWIQSSLELLSIKLNFKCSVKYLINRKNIELIPIFDPNKTSYNNPNVNREKLDTWMENFLKHKYIAIDNKLGIELSNIKKKPNDISTFIKKNNKKKQSILFENLLKK